VGQNHKLFENNRHNIRLVFLGFRGLCGGKCYKISDLFLYCLFLWRK